MGADARATFAVELQDETSGAAGNAANALERLRQKIKEDQTALAEMQAALRRLQGGTAVNIEAFKDLRAQIQAKKASLASAQQAFLQLGGMFGKTTEAAKETGGGLQELLGTAQAAGGPLGSLAGRAGQLSSVLGKAGAAGAALLLAAALVAVVVGLGVAVVALASFALQAADAARSSRLLLEAAAGSSAAGAALGAAVDAVAGRVALARGQIEEMALSLARTRLAGRALESAFSAVATATAVMGSAAGSKLQGIAEQAARTRRFVLGAFDLDGTGLKLADVAGALAKRLGVSFSAAVAAIQNGQVQVEDGLAALDDAVQAKFGNIAKAQLLSFSFQLQKTRENVGRLFSGVKIDAFLEGLRSVLSLLDQSTASGRALKAIAEGLLNPLFAALARGAPYARAFFQGMIIGALLATVALLRVKKVLSDAFGGESKSSVDGIKLAVYAGIAAFALLGGSVLAFAALMALAFAPLAVLLLGLGAAVLLLLSPLLIVGAAVYGLYLAFQAAYDAIAGIDFAGIGTNLLAGLANGIENGAAWAVNAIKRLASSMMGTLKAALGIASPSKVFDLYGRFTTKGFAQGIEGGTPEVEGAMRGLVSLPAADVASAPAMTVRSQRGGNTYNITIHGVKDAEQLKSPSFLAQLADALEGAAITGGMPLEPEPA
ncbi:MAG: hypothetical protein IT372_29935 [Polyangiaceae bacterium]|nr:hypothetical protein [Polyangiaceae bacterium]